MIIRLLITTLKGHIAALEVRDIKYPKSLDNKLLDGLENKEFLVL